MNDILPGANAEVEVKVEGEVDLEGLDDDTGVKEGRDEEENDKKAF